MSKSKNWIEIEGRIRLDLKISGNEVGVDKEVYTRGKVCTKQRDECVHQAEQGKEGEVGCEKNVYGADEVGVHEALVAVSRRWEVGEVRERGTSGGTKLEELEGVDKVDKKTGTIRNKEEMQKLD
ncbi:hypothetical protein PMAC_000257 [Pneumocystis sp. 'macacae']|nr:hypothetical protein PMAC_000257 [Pneumocystis sp. 'macacae']